MLRFLNTSKRRKVNGKINRRKDVDRKRGKEGQGLEKKRKETETNGKVGSKKRIKQERKDKKVK